MNYKDILAMTVLFVLLPMWVGYLWVEFLRLREGWNRLLHAWVLGFVTMLAVAQVILVPLVALEQTLTTAMILWKIALTVLSILSFGLLCGAGNAESWDFLREVRAPGKKAIQRQGIRQEGAGCMYLERWRQ